MSFLEVFLNLLQLRKCSHPLWVMHVVDQFRVGVCAQTFPDHTSEGHGHLHNASDVTDQQVMSLIMSLMMRRMMSTLVLLLIRYSWAGLGRAGQGRAGQGRTGGSGSTAKLCTVQRNIPCVIIREVVKHMSCSIQYSSCMWYLANQLSIHQLRYGVA